MDKAVESQGQTIGEQSYQSMVNEILPMRFGSLLSIPKLGWENFPGKANQNMKWSAHVYWNIEFHVIKTGKRPTISVGVHMLPKSWVKDHKKCDHLLNHQQGHFLIGNLCALEFLRRVHTHHAISTENFEQYVNAVFMRTFKEYLEMEKRYDEETEHRLNYKKQLEWDQMIKEKLMYYEKVFDKKKNKFILLKNRG